MDKTFNYVIARPWYPEDKDSALCVFALFGQEVHRGTMKYALDALAYANGFGKSYSIYKVKFKKVKQKAS